MDTWAMVWMTGVSLFMTTFAGLYWLYFREQKRHYQAIQARLPQREPMSPSGHVELWMGSTSLGWHYLPTENSASRTSSESAPPSTPMPTSLSSEPTVWELTGDLRQPSPSGSPVRGATPVEETPTESGPAVQRIDMSRGKRESKL